MILSIPLSHKVGQHISALHAELRNKTVLGVKVRGKFLEITYERSNQDNTS